MYFVETEQLGLQCPLADLNVPWLWGGDIDLLVVMLWLGGACLH